MMKGSGFANFCPNIGRAVHAEQSRPFMPLRSARHTVIQGFCTSRNRHCSWADCFLALLARAPKNKMQNVEKELPGEEVALVHAWDARFASCHAAGQCRRRPPLPLPSLQA